MKSIVFTITVYPQCYEIKDRIGHLKLIKKDQLCQLLHIQSIVSCIYGFPETIRWLSQTYFEIYIFNFIPSSKNQEKHIACVIKNSYCALFICGGFQPISLRIQT